MVMYGYARVSTTGQTLEQQVDLLLEAGVLKDNIYAEKMTGRTMKRPVFLSLLERCKPGDQIVVTKLDRLGRSTRQALNTLEPLIDQGIEFNILNMGAVDNSPMGMMILRVMLAVSEMEADLIKERTAEKKTWLRANVPEWKEGRPPVAFDARRKHCYDLLQIKSYREVEQLTGKSKSTLQRIKREGDAYYKSQNQTETTETTTADARE